MKRSIRRLVVIAAGAAALGAGAVATAGPASASGDLCAQGSVSVEGPGTPFGSCMTLPVGNGSDCVTTYHYFGATGFTLRACVPVVG